MECPSCNKTMELITPNNSENYYKCPFCGIEESEEDAVDRLSEEMEEHR